MSPRAGCTTPDLLEAGTNRLLVAAARILVVLAERIGEVIVVDAEERGAA